MPGPVSADGDRDRAGGQPWVARQEQAEIIRKRYRYRTAVLRREVQLPPDAAARLIGPDCAYHLYARAWVRPRPRPD